MPENPPQSDPDENPQVEGAPPPPPAGEAPPPPPGEPPAARKLTRSRSDRIIGGVAGGLGRYFGVDPILFRIAFVVLVFAGGIGLLAYVGLLAFVPAGDGGDGGEGGEERRDTNMIAAVLVVILAVVVISPPVFFLGPVLLPAALLIGIGLVLWRAAGGATPAGGDPARLVARAAVAFLIGVAAVGGFVGVFLLAAIGGGTTLAILAIVAGVALVVAAFAGGARWLIVPALILVLPLAIVAAADIEIEGGFGEHRYRPTSAAEVRPDYRLGMGELIVDLREADLPPGRTDVRVDVGVGHAVVRVAEDVCVTSDVEVGVGQASVFDDGSGGVDVAFQQAAAPAAGAPVLHVDADVGIGAVNLRRGDDPLWDRGFADEGVACP